MIQWFLRSVLKKKREKLDGAINKNSSWKERKRNKRNLAQKKEAFDYRLFREHSLIKIVVEDTHLNARFSWHYKSTSRIFQTISEMIWCRIEVLKIRIMDNVGID